MWNLAKLYSKKIIILILTNFNSIRLELFLGYESLWRHWLLAFRLKSSFERKIRLKIHQSSLYRLTHQHTTQLAIEASQRETSSSDVMGSKRSLAMLQPYQHGRRNGIKWPSGEDGQADTLIRTALCDSDRWHCNKVTVIHY